MKEKAKTKNNRNRKRSSMSKLFARTSSPNVTRERDWQTDVPNIKLSRAFVVVLIIHVVALGGILAFEMFKPKPAGTVMAVEKSQKMTDLEKKARDRAPISVADADDSKFDKVPVQTGDSLDGIARRFGLKREDILKVNRIDNTHQLFHGRVLLIPKEGRRPVETVVSTNKPSTINERPPAAVPVREEAPPAPSVPTESTPPVADSSTKVDDDFASLDDLLSDLGGTPEEVGSPESFETIPAPDPILEARKNEASEFDSWNTTPEIVTPSGVPSTPKPESNSRATVVRKVPATQTMKENPAPVKKKTTSPAVATAKSHKVLPKETFYSISRKYGVSVSALQKANAGTDPSRLQIGQTLRIPR